jgi:diguanylate cyclase (GGDEF)-like protein
MPAYPHPSNTSHARLPDLIRELDQLSQEINKDRNSLKSIDTPMSLMVVRAETAEAALLASDIALKALKELQINSMEIIASGDIVIASMKAIIKENDKDTAIKEHALAELTKIIEKNKASLKASAQALTAVNELAFNDDLTGLPNRRLLNDRLRHIISTNKRWSSYGAAIFLDLDNFKKLNDEHGHEAGDELLIMVGQRLKLAVRDTDTVARYGGDEFVVLLSRLNGNMIDARAESEIVATKILDALAPPYTLHLHMHNGLTKEFTYQNFASLGVTMFGGDLSQESLILDWADEAMYWAKSEGGRKIRFYDSKNSTEQALTKLYQMAIDNDDETSNHGIRTRKYVKTLANRSYQMNIYPDQLSDEIIERLFKTTQLHDIGKTKIPYAILHKKEKFTPPEWEVMKTHAALGGKILETARRQNADLTDLLNTAIDIATGHHENWDGSGYPKGLAGNEIPLGGRLMAIADVYDALISKRSYKKAWRHTEACAEVISLSGTKFDPYLIEAFKREMDNFRLIAEIAKD